MNEQHRFSYLLNRFLSKTISPGEKDEFFDLLLSNDFDETLGQKINDDYLVSHEGADIPPHIAQEIIRNILVSEKKTLETIRDRKTVHRSRWLWAAAAILAGMFLIGWLGNALIANHKPGFTSVIPDLSIRHTNSGNTSETIILPDKSAITLQPASTLHYPRKFTGTAREVYLEGTAFFNVTKNPNQPFFVYYNKVVTKVLGTSFEVGTNDRTGDVEVSVKSGRVQVFENSKLVEEHDKTASVIVMPNQKAIYKSSQGIFESTLVEHPQPVKLSNDPSSVKSSSFVFEQAKLSSIFKLLEEVYAVSIVVENETIYNCVFSGDLLQQDLFEKLKVICLTINADYEINETKILIKGKGCNP